MKGAVVIGFYLFGTVGEQGKNVEEKRCWRKEEGKKMINNTKRGGEGKF